MNLVTSIYTNEELNILKDSLDYVLINVPHLSVNYKDIDIDSAVEFCKKNNIKPILSINRIMHPGDLSSVKALISKYNNQVMYLCADLGVVNLMLEAKLIENTIYNPETMITNYLDGEIYNSLGVNAIGISSEITIDAVKEIYNKTNANIYYQGFGKRLMFYSRRKLITLYSLKNGEEYPKVGYLKEVTRPDYLPFIENDEDTLVYRPYNISLLSLLPELDFIKYLYVESFDMDINTFKCVNEIYYDSLKNGNIRENMLKLNELSLNVEDGFFYKDSVYQKEELKK